MDRCNNIPNTNIFEPELPKLTYYWQLMKKHFLIIFAIAVFANFQASPAQADLKACFNLFQKKQVKEQPADLSKLSVNEVIAKVKETGVPAFTKSTPQGDLAVILVNSATIEKLQPLIKSSFGTAVHLQPTWKNDHGSLRLGSWLIDVDTPGARGFGEINQTGIAWRNIDDYVKRSTSNIIETGFLLSPDEMKVASLYQKIRRSALYRVPFTFGNQEVQAAANMLKSGEHCFVFSKGSVVGSHVYEIKERLQKLGINSEDLLKNPEVERVFEDVVAEIVAMEPGRLKENDVLKALEPLTDALKNNGLSSEIATEASRWIVALRATESYQQLLENLGVTGGTGFDDMRSARARFVFVFDSIDKEPAFRGAEYTAKGYFNIWEKSGQKPIL